MGRGRVLVSGYALTNPTHGGTLLRHWHWQAPPETCSSELGLLLGRRDGLLCTGYIGRPRQLRRRSGLRKICSSLGCLANCSAALSNNELHPPIAMDHSGAEERRSLAGPGRRQLGPGELVSCQGLGVQPGPMRPLLNASLRDRVVWFELGCHSAASQHLARHRFVCLSRC